MKKLLTLFLPIIMAFAISQNAIAEEADTYISKTAQEACYEYGEQYNICPEFLMAIIETESGGRSDAIGGGCVGLMQISPRWHRDRMKRLDVTDLFDERSNILVGADYLAELFEKYEDAAVVLMIYHGEKDAVKKAEQGDISDYASGILERTAELERIHEKKKEARACIYLNFGLDLSQARLWRR